MLEMLWLTLHMEYRFDAFDYLDHFMYDVLCDAKDHVLSERSKSVK